MCGRYVSVQSDAALLEEFEAVIVAGPADAADQQSPARQGYNVAPTDAVRVVVNRRVRDADGEQGDYARQLRQMRWGLVPSWAKDRRGAARMINARVETAPTASAFRRAWAARRALVPANGWYEWRVLDGKAKQAFYMTPDDGAGLAFAGLYEFWGPPGQTLTTFTILTADAIGNLEYVHDRMPLIVPRADWGAWLDPDCTDPAPFIDQWRIDQRLAQMELRPVSDRVNSVRNDGPDLLTRESEPTSAAPDQAPLF